MELNRAANTAKPVKVFSVTPRHPDPTALSFEHALVAGVAAPQITASVRLGDFQNLGGSL